MPNCYLTKFPNLSFFSLLHLVFYFQLALPAWFFSSASVAGNLLGLPKLAVPEDEPHTPEKIALKQRLLTTPCSAPTTR